jgi:hypothetical protein
MGSRYGKKVAGWWFDDRYPLQPFEQIWKATRTGSTDRLAAFNSWILPKATEFQDYYAGEVGGALKVPPAKGYFDSGGPQAGLSPQILILLDDPWAHGRTNTAIQDPLFKDEDLIRYVVELSGRNIPVTMNIGVYQDGTASPATLAQLRAVRRAIRGK